MGKIVESGDVQFEKTDMRPDVLKVEEKKQGSVKTRPAYDYAVVKADTYTQGVGEIRESWKDDPVVVLPDTSSVYRPLTFKENLEWRIAEYENAVETNRGMPERELKGLLERLPLFSTWLNSCTGIAYKAKSARFKIIPACTELITLSADYCESALWIPYADVKGGITLDRTHARYNELLTKEEALEHEAWLAAVEGDTQLLKTYVAIIFKYRNPAMGFWRFEKLAKDQVRALCVYGLGDYSDAGGYGHLSDNARFLRVSPRSAAT